MTFEKAAERQPNKRHPAAEGYLEPVYDLDQGMQCKAKMAEKAEHTRSM